MERKICQNCGCTPDKIWDAPLKQGTWGYWCPRCFEVLTLQGAMNKALGKEYFNKEEGLERVSKVERQEKLEGEELTPFVKNRPSRRLSEEPSELASTLMKRDNLGRKEVEILILQAAEELNSVNWIDEVEFMADWFSLEPDYFMDIAFL